jgi:DNA-binding PucR family transcriptional regulator
VRVVESLEMPAERLAAQARAGRDAGGGPGADPDAEPEPPLHQLLLASVPAPVLRSFSDRLLGPLQQYDDRHNAELISTLRSFLACDGSWSACASRMYVHVNTVRYRIGRVEALTGRDLSALADRVDFFLALRGAWPGALSPAPEPGP